MKIAVIGGSGFLGRHIIERLLSEPDVFAPHRISEIVCVDLRKWPSKAAADLPASVTFVQGDIMDQEVRLIEMKCL